MATTYSDPTMSALLTKGTTQANTPVGPMQGPVKPVQPVKKTASGFSYNNDQLATIYKHNPNRAVQLGYVAPASEVTVGAEELGKANVAIGGDTGMTTSPLSKNLAGTTTVRTDAQQPMSARDQAVANLMGVYQEGQLFNPDEIRRQEGVFAQRDIVNKLSEQYDSALVEQRRTIQEMRQNPEGKLVGALNADIENYKYESDQNLADKAMALHYAREDYQAMYDTAQSAIEAENQRYERQMSFWQTMYTVLGDDMTDSEQAMFNSQLRERENFNTAMYETKSEAARIAGVNGAPADVMAAIKNAQTPQDAWIAAGQYGIDPNLSWQKSRFAAEQKLAWAKYELDAAAKAGDISAETAQKLIAQKQNDAVYANLQENILSAFNNKAGLDVTTGKVKGAMMTSLFDWTGEGGGYFPNKMAQEELAVNMNFITSQSTLNALAEAKARGITFGALSEQEMNTVANSANTLATAWDSESQKFIGSRATIEKALTDLYNTVSEKKVDNSVGIETSNAMTSVWNQL